ncbi:MAG: hypothetical protein CMJ58_13730 [Planctomycetaceae bacterium]|nr:hypothetical protein [Planctomycetaceae bacterium]
MPALTPQQAAALAAHDRSVSLAAGAGCGKTFVLTERFLAYLDPTVLEPTAELEELVAITFTEAAAREMRERIREKCRERMTDAPETTRPAWRRLIRQLDGARISTIHGFCTRLLRRHAVEAGVDPQFEVLDAAAGELLLAEAVDDTLRELLEARHEAVLDLAARRGLNWVRGELARVASQTTRAQLTHWQSATVEDLTELWQQAYQREAPKLLLAELRDSDPLTALAAQVDLSAAATPKLADHFVALAAALDAIRSGEGDPVALADDLDGLARVRGGPSGSLSKKDWHDPQAYDEFKTAAEEVRKLLGKLKKLDVPTEQSRAAAQMGVELVALAATIRDRIDAVKAQRNQLDFDDLLERTHRLLTDPAHDSLRRELAAETRLLMVDEFQDTDPLQVEIVQTLCGDGWRDAGLFVVGDDKQSIYRFRGAEPDVSHALRQSLPAAGQLSLTTNFRSQPAVIDFVNATFRSEFRDYEPLVAHRPQQTPCPAIEFMWPPTEDPDDGLAAANAASGRATGGRREARQREARWIARRIAQLIDSGEPLIPDHDASEDAGDALRPVRPGDVAILLRALSDVSLYEEALRQQGIDYYLAGGHAFYAQQEIFDVVNLLRAVASLIDEIALAGALRSPLFALQDETLFWLVKAHGSLNAALAAAPPSQLEAREAAKVQRAAATLAHLRQRKDQLLVAELLDEALARTGYDAVLQAEFLGARKLANLEKLREQARTLDRTAPGDLPGFVTQLSEFVARAPKEAPAATQTTGDVVQIMTIHNAKGLEFPVVVLPDVDRQSRPADAHAVVHRELGPLAPGENRQHGLGWQLYRALENQQERQERLRLFYVACTRAADMLIVSGSRKDPAKPQSEAMKLLARRYDVETGDYAGEQLPPGIGVPSVRVIDAEPAPPRIPEGPGRSGDLQQTLAKCEKLAARKSTATKLPPLALPMAVDRSARRRFSFSQLTGELEALAAADLASDGSDSGFEEQLPVGSDLRAGDSSGSEGALDPRHFGSLVHDVLERVNFADTNDAARWCEFLAPMYFPRGAAEAAATALDQVTRLLASERGAALAGAAEVRREVEFLLPWPPGGDRQPAGGRYLHGYIDCLYRDAAGAWHLLDYKTNRTTAARIPQTAANYELQLFVYQLACEQALRAPLAEATLLLLDPGGEHSFAWDEAQAASAIARITAAMDRIVQQ